MAARKRAIDEIKANGVHYTPVALASFLANELTKVLLPRRGVLRVLDPACGDGGLLVALTEAIPRHYRSRLVLAGFERNPAELAKAQSRLESLGVREIDLQARDFLEVIADSKDSMDEGFDAVIANPPYVRTQVLGAAVAQRWAKKFGLKGRIDLYHVFIAGMVRALKSGGSLGLLTSNRFLTIESGASVRKLLCAQVDLRHVFDLGDTKMFSAAVLPVIVIGVKGQGVVSSRGTFDRIYEVREKQVQTEQLHSRSSVLQAIQDRQIVGEIETKSGRYLIERGNLDVSSDAGWSLSTREIDTWLATVRQNQSYTFGDIARVRVGVKTTADDVFIRSDWQELPRDTQPEKDLLRPLLTSDDADRWLAKREVPSKRVLYPHVSVAGKRLAVDLAKYPRARRYLGTYKESLSRRKYVADAGRQWYEIWVPHQPSDWIKPKVVFPDISEHPRVFLDRSSAVVNGDCYWITLKDGVDPDYLLLLLAVANSRFITKYYDARFHNKLYAGRRRFMTQYVNEFPVPDIASAAARKILKIMRRLQEGVRLSKNEEARMERYVCQSLGVPELDADLSYFPDEV